MSAPKKDQKPCKRGHPVNERYRAPNGRLRCRSCVRLVNARPTAKKQRPGVIHNAIRAEWQ